MRKKGPVFEWKENTEYISGFAHNHTKRILLAPRYGMIRSDVSLLIYL